MSQEAQNKVDHDFTDSPEIVKSKPSKSKGIDLNDPSTYREVSDAERTAKKAADEASNTNELDRLITESQRPDLAVARLNNELINGYEQIYSAQNDYQLNKIISDKESKPWQKEAAKNVMHTRIRGNREGENTA